MADIWYAPPFALVRTWPDERISRRRRDEGAKMSYRWRARRGPVFVSTYFDTNAVSTLFRHRTTTEVLRAQSFDGVSKLQFARNASF